MESKRNYVYIINCLYVETMSKKKLCFSTAKSTTLLKRVFRYKLANCLLASYKGVKFVR